MWVLVVVGTVREGDMYIQKKEGAHQRLELM